jgi:hypothetical protein
MVLRYFVAVRACVLVKGGAERCWGLEDVNLDELLRERVHPPHVSPNDEAEI